MELKKWYQLKRVWILAGVFVFSALGIADNSITPAKTGLISNANIIQAIPQSEEIEILIKKTEDDIEKTKVKEPEIKQEQTVKNTKNLSNNNSYLNVDGDRVQAPAYSLDGSIPSGASAKCKDGTYSFSQNRRGTCSGHGGVSVWY
jgi:CHAT domain-containing protein